jgi:uncharacterized protein Usg
MKCLVCGAVIIYISPDICRVLVLYLSVEYGLRVQFPQIGYFH